MALDLREEMERAGIPYPAKYQSTEIPSPIPPKPAELGSFDLREDMRRAGLIKDDLNSSAFEASFFNPSEEAQRRSISKSLTTYLGDTTPPAILDIPDATRRLRIAEADHATRATPRTRAWLSNEENAKIALDDAKTLAGIERAIDESTRGRINEIDRTFWQGITEPIRRGLAKASEFVTIGASEAGLYDGDEAGRAVRIAQKRREQQAFPIPQDIQSGLEEIQRAGEVGFTEALSAVAKNPRAVVEVALESMGSSSASLALGSAGSIGGPWGRAAATAVGSYVTEYASVLSEATGDSTDPLAIAAALRDEKKMAAARDKAAIRGIPIALFDGLTAGLAGKILAGAKPTVASVGGRAAGELAMQSAGGAAGEAAAGALVGDFNWGNVLLEAFAELPTAIVEVPGNLAHYRDLKAKQVTESAGSMQTILDLAKVSELAKRDKGAFAEFFSQAVGDQSIFIHPEQLRAAAQEAGLEQSVVEGLFSGQPEADQTGIVEVPMDRLLMTFQNTPAEQSIINNVRVGTPDMPTLAEVERDDASAMEFFKAEADKIIEKAGKDAIFQSELEDVRNEVITRLEAANPFGKTKTLGYASAVVQAYATFAQRLGITPKQLIEGWTDKDGNRQAGIGLMGIIGQGGQVGEAGLIGQSSQMDGWITRPTGWHATLYVQKQDNGKFRVASQKNYNPISPSFDTEAEAAAWADQEYGIPPTRPISAPVVDQASAILDSLPAGATDGLSQTENGEVVFNVEDAARGIASGETPSSVFFQGVTSPTPAGRFMRGDANKVALPADEVVRDALISAGLALRPEDQSASVQEAWERGNAYTYLSPIVVDMKKPLRWDGSPQGFYGNEKMAFPNDAYPSGRNTWDIPGCGRVAWATANGQNLKEACYGGACYAEALIQANQGKQAGATTGVRKLPANQTERQAVNDYFAANGLEATIAEVGDRLEIKINQLKGSKNYGKLSIGKYFDAAGNPVAPKMAGSVYSAAVITTNLKPAKGQDIRLGVDSDGAAWLADERMLDALLAADPRSLSVYSSAYHSAPPPHALSGRTIINVTISGWHPLPETFSRLRWAEEARANGWNVILREVVANPDATRKDGSPQFPAETVEVYNRVHDALLKTDFFVMLQSLHVGNMDGSPVMLQEKWGIPACCKGSDKNPGTCDACEVAEGLGSQFQKYWGIAEENVREEKILPDVPDYRGVQFKGIPVVKGGQVGAAGMAQKIGQTNTPEFRNWFGDSKVVDAEGKPLVVYHGTTSSFDAFSKKFQGAVTRATSSKSGFFFTSSPRTAQYYADHGALVTPVERLVAEAEKAGDRGNWDLYDEKINAAEKLEAELSDPANRGRGQNIVPVYLNLRNPLIIDAKGETPQGIGGIDPLIQNAKRNGHDGVIIRNFDDAAGLANDRSDHYVVFDPTQIKSVNNRGTFAPTDANILRQESRDTWYSSALTKAIENTPDRIFNTGKQVASWLQANSAKLGVKADEIQWSGVTDWLATKGKVTKADVLAYLQAGGVKVEEVMLGAQSNPDWMRSPLGLPGGWVVNQKTNGSGGTYWEVRDPANKQQGWSDTSREEAIGEARAWAEGLYHADIGTKFAQYQLPGGENYRELLLTLPDSNADEGMRALALLNGPEWADSVEWEETENGWSVFAGPSFGEGPTKEAAAIAFLHAYSDKDGDVKSGAKFQSSHFDQPNILAHVRFNERTDANGKRVLFIEEIQSDWGQKGKKEGFGRESMSDDRLRELIEQNDPNADTEGLTRAQLLAMAADAGVKGGPIPTAPFVTDTKAWTGLALKRMIAYAAANGFDRIAWTNGEQQAARYDLSKSVDSLIAGKEDDGTYSIVAIRDGREVIKRDNVPASNLPDIVGKDLADKIISGLGKDIGLGEQEFLGLDLKVGGEGMKAFYDQIVPQVANDVLRKIGGGKVGEVEITVQGLRAGMIDPETGVVIGPKFKAKPDKKQSQPGFDITDKMRQSVESGLSLFQEARGQFSPNARAVFNKDGKIIGYAETIEQAKSQYPDTASISADPVRSIQFMAKADLSTFLHETSHWYLDILMDLASRPNAPAQIVDDAGKVLAWFGVSDVATWHAMTLDQQRQYHEKWAESGEQYFFEGKAPSVALEGSFRQFARWLKSVYLDMKRFFGIRASASLNPEIRSVFNRILATDAEIEAMTERREMKRFFDEKAQSGMSQADWDAYVGLNEEQKAVAEEELRARGLRDLRWVRNMRNKRIAELQKTARGLRAEAMIDARREVLSSPLYQAWAFLTSRMEKEIKVKKAPRATWVDPTVDTMFAAIAKLGGMKREEVSSEWGIQKTDKPQSGIFGKPVFRENGRSIDDMRQALISYGYLDENEFDPREFEEKFFEELRGNHQRSIEFDYAAIQEQRRQMPAPEEVAYRAGRIDRATVIDWYGSEHPVVTHLESLKMLGENGMHPDDVADTFGFSSGDEMMRTLAVAPTPREAIEQKTDEIMLAEHGEFATQKAIELAADEAMHNDARTRMVATELSALNKAAGSPSVLAKAAREYASAIVDRRTYRTLKPWVFSSEEVRQAKIGERALTKGENETAIAAKRAEMVNHAAAKEAHRALREAEANIKWFKKIASYKDSHSSVKSRDGEIVNLVRVVLSRYGIGAEASVDKAKLYLDNLAQYEPDLAAGLQETLADLTDTQKDYRDLTILELRELYENVAALWTIGRESMTIEVDGKRMELSEVRAQLVERLNRSAKEKKGPKPINPTRMDQLAIDTMVKVRGATRVEQWVGMKDGEEYGPWRKFIWMAINDAQLRYEADKLDKIKRIRDLAKTIEKDLVIRKIPADELEDGLVFGAGSVYGMSEILHAMAHSGNISNLSKLLVGRGWGTIDSKTGELDRSKWDAFLKKMHDDKIIRKEHWDFVQGIWDVMESMKPGAQKTHRAIHGRYFNEVTANEVVTPFGTYKGGYVPATTAPDAGVIEQHREEIKAGQPTVTQAKASPFSGFTKGRVEGYKGKLLLDIQKLSRHVDEVLLFTHMAVPVRDAQRLLKGDEMDAALMGADRAAYSFLLIPFLERAATQVVAFNSKREWQNARIFSTLRNRAGFAAMFANVVNTAQQAAGVATAVGSGKVSAKYMLDSLASKITRGPSVSDFVAGKSAYMNTRMKNEVAAASEAMDSVLVDRTLLQKTDKWVATHAYFMQSAFDNFLSPIIWKAKYSQVMEQGHKDGMTADELAALERQAIELADNVVRTTQGANRAIDISAMEAGSPFWRMFMQFAGYFNSQINTLGESIVFAKQLPTTKQRAQRIAFILAIGAYVPAVVGELIVQAFKFGPGDDDQDGEYIDDWLMSIFVTGPKKYALAMVPIVGPSINSLTNAFNDKPYDDRMVVSPAVSMLESAAKGVSFIVKEPFSDKPIEKPSKPIRDVGTLISMGLGVPVTPATKTLGYLADVQTGRVSPSSELDFIRGTITGAASPGTK